MAQKARKLRREEEEENIGVPPIALR